MNSLTITGYLGRDIELRSLSDGTPVGGFSVADSQGRDKPTIWWRCSLFGKRAESLAPYLKKGQQVTVVATVTEREYTDKDGQKRTAMDLRVNDVALQGGRPQESDSPRQAPARASTKQVSAFDDVDEDIPF